MKERPILFSAPMVRAILEGRKTQTRRILKSQGKKAGHYAGWVLPEYRTDCPYGQPGDRLWVRETWQINHTVQDADGKCPTIFRADGTLLPAQGMKWTPSIHMPRWACRIVLEITDVRVELLQSISDADARAEGCNGGHGSIPGYNYSATPREHFWQLWESIAAPGTRWEDDPWVWVITFRKVRG